MEQKIYISVMTTNLNGKNDNYHLIYSHVLLALIRKFHEAKVDNKKRYCAGEMEQNIENFCIQKI